MSGDVSGIVVDCHSHAALAAASRADRQMSHAGVFPLAGFGIRPAQSGVNRNPPRRRITSRISPRVLELMVAGGSAPSACRGIPFWREA